MGLILLVGVLVVFFAGMQTAKSSTTSSSTGPVVFLGDSHTWLGGNDCSCEEGWTFSYCSKFSAEQCRSYARSGATWTHTPHTRADEMDSTAVLSDDNVIYNQILRLRSDVASRRMASPAYIFILAGTNDAWFSSKRPHRFDVSVDEAFRMPDSVCLTLPPDSLTAFALALRYDCLLLQRTFPQARIVLLTPFESTAFPAGDLRKVASLIDSCSHRLHTDLVRLDSPSVISAERERRVRTFTTDGTHTNRAGARRIADHVARQLMERGQVKRKQL